jgi:hypothetical protein
MMVQKVNSFGSERCRLERVRIRITELMGVEEGGSWLNMVHKTYVALQQR